MCGLQFSILAQCFQETSFAEFFCTQARCLRNSVGIHTQDISDLQLNGSDGTLPFREQTKDRGGRLKSFQQISPAEEYGRIMPTIDILQLSSGIAVMPEKQGHISLVRAVLEEVEIQR